MQHIYIYIKKTNLHSRLAVWQISTVLETNRVQFSDGSKLLLLVGFAHVTVGFTPPGSPDSQLHSAPEEKQTLVLLPSISHDMSTLHFNWAFSDINDKEIS